MANLSNDKVISKIKEWLSPGLISFVGMVLWMQLTELKQDVRTLLINQGIVETKVFQLEKEVDYMKNRYSYGQQANLYLPRIAKKEDGPEVPTGE
jgi:hypothetical protein